MGTSSQTLMFGNQNQNADGAHNCLTYANSGHGGVCITSSGSFATDPSSVEFGPLHSAATISTLNAVSSVAASGQTVTVLDNTGATALACTNTTGTSCSDTTDSVTVAAGDFLQVQVSGGTAAAWKVTLVLS
jgi:hypothetical protein